MLKRLIFAALALAPIAALAGSIPLLHVGLATTPVVSNLKTPIFTTFRISVAGTSWFGAGPGTFTGSEQNSVLTTSTTRRVPIPFAATITHLHSNLGTAPTGTDTVTASKTVTNSAADGTVTCTYGSNTATSCKDDTHSDTYAAGNLFQAHFTVSDSQTQASPGQLSWILTATGGQLSALMNQPSAGAFVSTSASPSFFAPGSGGASNDTQISFQFCPSCSGTILGFFLVPNVTETGIHTWTITHNTVATGMTFNTSSASTGGGAAGACISPNGASDSIGGGTVVNPCTSNAGLTFTVAPGDTIAVSGNCPAGTGCATAIPGFAIIYSPNTSGVVPLSATASFNHTNGSSSWFGASSNVNTTGQSNFQQIPAAMTFSSYQYCSLTNAATGTKTGAFQTGATPGALPTTPGTTLSVTYAPGAGACPNNATFLAGGQDVNPAHNVTVAADQTVDSILTDTAVSGTQLDKVSMAVNVP